MLIFENKIDTYSKNFNCVNENVIAFLFQNKKKTLIISKGIKIPKSDLIFHVYECTE